MKSQRAIEFIDSASNARLSLSELRRLGLIHLYRTLESLQKRWSVKKKYRSYPNPKRILIFYTQEDFIIAYTVEFDDFPSISCGIGGNVVRQSSTEELSDTIAEQIIGKIRELKSTTYWQNKAPKMWWDDGR